MATAVASLRQVAAEAAHCHRCPLWKPATQTVVGEGPAPATLMLVGEQPGDREDLEGHPFVGPAGGVLRRALGDAGLDDVPTYMTNIVKHFKFQERGKRRIHQKPTRSEVKACRPWFDAEMRFVAPRALAVLGAVAARELLGTSVSVTRDRGRPIESDLAPLAFVTVHPSSVLRAEERRRSAYDAFVRDLLVIGEALT